MPDSGITTFPPPKKIIAIIDLHKLSNLLSRRRRRQDELQSGSRSATATVTTVRVGRFDDDDVDKDGLVRLQIERRPRRGNSDGGETGGGASPSLFLRAPRLRSEVRLVMISIAVVMGRVVVWLTRTRAS